jgi:hypothetical protein
MLRKCLAELRAIYAEAQAILKRLLVRPKAKVVRQLCLRFYILQEYFATRYLEARAHAIAAMGSVETAASLA